MAKVRLLDWLRFRAGIFDVRDTLVALDPEYRDLVYLMIIRDFGKRTGNRYLSSFDKEDLHQLLRMGPKRRQEALERFGIDQDSMDAAWVSEEVMRARMAHSHVHRDAAALQVLKKRGVKLGLVTSSAKRAADVDVGIIKGKVGSRVFDEIVMPSYEPNLAAKPDPASVIACLERLRVPPEEAFGVGNTERDISAYRSAGVFDILIDRPNAYKSAAYDGPEPSMRIMNLGELVPLIVQRGRLSLFLRRKPLVWSGQG